MEDKAFYRVLKTFVLSKGLIILWIAITFLLSLPIDYRGYNGEGGILNVFTYFDSKHYIMISKYGYFIKDYYAFFPLYPMLIKVLNLTGLSYALCGVIISWVCNFFAGFYIYKLMPKEKSLWILFLNPIIIFMSSVYTESLFLLLCLSAYYHLSKKDNIITGILLGLCCLTRNMGGILSILILLKIILEHRKLTNILKLTIPLIIIGGIYPTFLLIKTGNPFSFITSQSQFNRILTNPFNTLYIDFLNLLNKSEFSLIIIMNFLSILLSLSLIIYFYKSEKLLCLFLLLGTIIPLCTPAIGTPVPATISEVRYVFGLFPIYLLIPKIKMNKYIEKTSLIFYLFSMGIITVLISMRKFIA